MIYATAWVNSKGIILSKAEPISKAHGPHASSHITFSSDKIIEMENKLVVYRDSERVEEGAE